MTRERLAFDASKYQNANEGKFARDLGGLFLELGERVTPFTWQIKGETIVCPEYDKTQDVGEQLRNETKSDRLETEYTLALRRYFLKHEKPAIAVWISPPDLPMGYPNSTMVISFRAGKKMAKIVHFGFPIELSRGGCLSLANHVAKFSEQNAQEFQTTDQLRRTPIIISICSEEGGELDDLMRIASEIIPLPDWIWAKISSPETKKISGKATRDAEIIAEALQPLLQRAETREEFIRIGAMAEMAMVNSGWPVRRNSGCGSLNSEISTFSESHIHLGPQGKIETKRSEAGVFVKKCPHCGETINKVIKANYKCPNCGKFLFSSQASLF